MCFFIKPIWITSTFKFLYLCLFVSLNIHRGTYPSQLDFISLICSPRLSQSRVNIQIFSSLPEVRFFSASSLPNLERIKLSKQNAFITNKEGSITKPRERWKMQPVIIRVHLQAPKQHNVDRGF